MHTSFVEAISIQDKRTESVIKAYIKNVYTYKGGSKFILTDRGSEFSSEAMSYIAEQLGFTKVYASSYSPKSKSIIKRCHSFLKNSIRNMRCNNDVEWDELVHIAKMAYNIFPPFSYRRESVLLHVWKRCLSANPVLTSTTQDEIHGRQ